MTSPRNESPVGHGTIVGPCELVRLIGRGGMGEVHLARHIALDKEVAVKLLSDKYAGDPAQVKSFLREAKLAAKLDDEHIVQIYDVGIEGERPYIVMQLARGTSLRTRLKQGNVHVEQSLQIVERIARGLFVAHSAGIVHRDIKPHNVILTDDDNALKILDFGLARFEQSLCSRDQYGEIVGSIAYMAPEQIDYAPVDGRSDIYSLGVTAYQCLTGALPFRGSNEGGNNELMVRHQFELPQAPSLLNPDVPLTVSRVILKMLEKRPDDRYSSAEELLAELRLLRRHSLPMAHAPWRKRPLNPQTLESGEHNGKVLRAALRKQRDAFSDGADMQPLSDMKPKLKLKWRPEEKVVSPADLLTLESVEGGKSASLNELSSAVGEFRFRSSFEVNWLQDGTALELIVRHREAISSMEAQHLYDLLEALPLWPTGLSLHLGADYLVQPQDVRWIVDLFNIAGGNEVKLTVIVGSTKNYDTLVRLGLDQHMDLRLELEHTETGLKSPLADIDPRESLAGVPSELVERDEYPGLEALTSTQRARVTNLAHLLQRSQLHEASSAWRQLAGDLPNAMHATLAPLKHELFGLLNDRANERFDKQELENAEELYSIMVDLDPKRYEGHLGKGLVFKKRNKNDYASAFLTQAILNAPDVADSFYHRAIVRSRMGDEDGAIKDLSIAIDHAPRHASAYYNRALLYKKVGRDDLSQRDALIAKRLNPDLFRAKSKRQKATT